MRRLVLLTAMLSLPLAFSPAGHADLASYLAGEATALELAGGRGTAILRSRDGAVLGTLAKGTLVVHDWSEGPETEVRISGCERFSRPARRTRECTGRRISFSVLAGAWRASIEGSKINASAVLRGSVTLRGTGGTYAIGNGPARRWPHEPETFYLR